MLDGIQENKEFCFDDDISILLIRLLVYFPLS